HLRLRGDRPPPELRLRRGRGRLRRARRAALRRPQAAHDPGLDEAGAPPARSDLPVPRLREPPLPRGPPHRALGRRWRDQPPEYGGVLLVPPSLCSRVRLVDRATCRRSAVAGSPWPPDPRRAPDVASE